MNRSLDGAIPGNAKVLLRIKMNAESGRTTKVRDPRIADNHPPIVSDTAISQNPVSRLAHKSSQRTTAKSGAPTLQAAFLDGDIGKLL